MFFFLFFSFCVCVWRLRSCACACVCDINIIHISFVCVSVAVYEYVICYGFEHNCKKKLLSERTVKRKNIKQTQKTRRLRNRLHRREVWTVNSADSLFLSYCDDACGLMDCERLTGNYKPFSVQRNAPVDKTGQPSFSTRKRRCLVHVDKKDPVSPPFSPLSLRWLESCQS